MLEVGSLFAFLEWSSRMKTSFASYDRETGREMDMDLEFPLFRSEVGCG